MDLVGPIVANGALSTGAMWLYLHALKKDGEVSRVMPWFQMVPLFGSVGAFVFLREVPTLIQGGGILFLVVGGFVLSVKNGMVKYDLIKLMTASSILLALSDVVFAKFGRRADDPVIALFIDVLGKAMWGLPLLFIPKYKKGFVIGLKSKLGLQSASEVFTIGANLAFDWGKLLAPVAIVQATACSAPLYGLLAIVICTKFFPKILHEELKGNLLQKVIGTVLIVGGGLAVTVFG